MKNDYQRFHYKYFRRELDFRARLFNIMALSGTAISFFTALQSLLTHLWVTALVSACMMFLSLAILLYAAKSGNYRRCYAITITVIFFLFFPLLFFTSGGYRGGMPSVFIFAALFTMLMLDGWRAFAVLAAEMSTYCFVAWLCYAYPQYVHSFDTEKDILRDVQFGFTAVSIICGLVIFFHLREYDQQRRQLKAQNEKLQQMDEAKSSFLTTVAHEVKNPLNIISLHAQDTAELLREPELDMEQLLENQRIIRDTVVRIDSILTDLMDTVSIEQGRLRLSRSPMMLEDVILDTAQPWKKQCAAGQNHTQLILQIEDDLPPIHADYNRLSQVLSNLLSNAFRHTPEGSITISLRQTEDGQQVCVTDTGEGMDPSIQEKALTGYVSGSREYWRHGIGLYVCHQIIEAHGGTIRIESCPGKGTRVCFTIPTGEESI